MQIQKKAAQIPCHSQETMVDVLSGHEVAYYHNLKDLNKNQVSCWTILGYFNHGIKFKSKLAAKLK